MPKKLLYAELVEMSRRAHEAEDNGTAHPDVRPLLDHILAMENDADIMKIRYDSLAQAVEMACGKAPRVVTTTDDLESLPDMSVIQSDSGHVQQKHGGEWYYTSDAAAPEKSSDMDVPTLVIYAPKEEV